MLGERPDAAPAVRPLSFGSVVGKGVHILSFISPHLPNVLDMHGDCRSLTYRDISISSLMKQLWKSDWAESRDATPFDVTFQAADEREADAEGNVDADTFYQSHVGCMVMRDLSYIRRTIQLFNRITAADALKVLKPILPQCAISPRP